MICSVLIPTRRRPDGLHKAIKALHATAKPENFDVWLRIDYDDEETLSRLREFEAYGNVHPVIGPRLTGYMSNGEFVTELAELAKGEWVYFTDDDGFLIGNGWDEQLKSVPKHGFIVHPEFYWLGATAYGNSGSCGVVAAFAPNGCWKEYGEKGLQSPTDAWLDSVMVDRNGWKKWLLKGITWKHERGNEDDLREFRKR